MPKPLKCTCLLLITIATLSCNTQTMTIGTEEPEIPTANQALEDWLAQPFEERAPLVDLAFAKDPLSKAEAQTARRALTEDRQAFIKSSFGAQWENRELQIGDLSMPFFYQTFGTKPTDGRSLFISLHGGGGAPAAVNDQQYENQKRLYDQTMRTLEGIYLAPRAPTNTWNLWHQSHQIEFLNRLIQLAVIYEDVNPNKVYLLGYSAGGDGVYQMAPRLADYWAAAAMMAGHPNDASPLSLSNLPFTIHMGAEDAAFNRNKKAEEWKGLLEGLAQR